MMEDEKRYAAIRRERRRRAGGAWAQTVRDLSHSSPGGLSFPAWNTDTICSILSQFANQPNVTFWPPVGSYKLTDVRLAFEHNCLELYGSTLDAPRIVCPRRLTVERIEHDLAQSFLWLELDNLEPLRDPPDAVANHERIWEVSPGRYFINDEVEPPEDENSDIPDLHPRLITRWYGGHILIVSPCSMLNCDRAEDGIYTHLSAAEIRMIIEPVFREVYD